jgi:hypothetical protein
MFKLIACRFIRSPGIILFKQQEYKKHVLVQDKNIFLFTGILQYDTHKICVALICLNICLLYSFEKKSMKHLKKSVKYL